MSMICFIWRLLPAKLGVIEVSIASSFSSFQVPNEKNNISFENVANPFNGDSGNFEGTALRRRRVKKSYEHTVRSPR